MSDPNASMAAAAPETVEKETYLGSELPPAPGKDRSRSLWSDAWRELRSSKIFIISAVLIVFFLIMTFFPQLMTFGKSPTTCDLTLSRQAPSSEAWFGYDNNGCDVYTRTIYGAKASILVGVFATLFTMFLGGFIGVIAGFFGGWVDSILSRVTDIFFAIPLLLGGILVLTSFPSGEDTNLYTEVAKVVLALGILGWTSMTRIMRSSVIQVRNADFVQAARALGAKNSRIIKQHVVPNSLAPLIVLATISLGGYIGAEATLSFLGLGLQPPVISWGTMINDAQPYIRVAPFMLFFPALFLSIAVLSFIMLGDAVREALDPKLR
ncbi:MAG: ABC transporter permease [Candidatus Nanopelagicales bacterium]|jgi:oligopeptide transport system permease protein|nr:ABC transporter permease [Candidatus Nanopelagicales bacterium]MCU0295833.1 ABC transporter permease [Candidatus Nanopelagicales bacterium]MCU0298960.1 ABC transporter permease [Candidatus Nanopelagicales bacterium]